MTRPGRHLKDLGPIYILALLKSDHVYTRDQGSAELALNISQCSTAGYQQYVTIVIVHLWDDEYNIGDPRHLLRYPGLGFRLCGPYPICRVRKHLPSSHNDKKISFQDWPLEVGPGRGCHHHLARPCDHDRLGKNWAIRRISQMI